MNFETRRESDTAYKTQNKTSQFKHILSDFSWINKIMNENNNNDDFSPQLGMIKQELLARNFKANRDQKTRKDKKFNIPFHLLWVVLVSVIKFPEDSLTLPY